MQANFLDMNSSEISAWLAENGEAGFRSKQLQHWIHQRGVIDFSQMTTLSLALREKLQQNFVCQWPQRVKEDVSSDGTIKWLFKLPEGNAVETVLIPERDRLTLCVSSQVGCALNCTFCATGYAGFNRNLKLSEIIGQLWLARERIAQLGLQNKISNVVFMGMGEPLLNYEPVLQAMRWMLDDNAYGLSKHRVTLSTSGVLPKMRQLREDCDVALALSLHAPNDELREKLVPLNKKYPLADLMQLCRDYFSKQPKRAIMMEYVMLAGVNDQRVHAKQLIRLLEGVRCKINLIPFNESKGLPYSCSSWKDIEQFQTWLRAAGYNVYIRRSRGDKEAAACGQLAGDFVDRTSRRRRLIKIHAQGAG